MSEIVLDLTGLKCPMPMLRTKKALAMMESGAVVKVLATDAGAPDDFAAFCKHTGHELLSLTTREDGVFELVIKHK
ncbi:sulfurtransferase TusA family protein [Kingella negevensis]|uniref:sulfurtransferase TusA family protein n=1 Tax=Kingella negevensis TaxID=1522312 RepID=UPI00050A2458|nr:sulfurtransferase TusA family protein [Kingella negevensis]MDK4680129.1 sulfurtransferase TusA family protein [Kingella negevensis]MDK4682151.1 sulfurtransferase TusA family protein [Kingella negevensis]MDK4690348.1 sulfurtransferase TusA family protein [Kingella negevensis]MDK4692304.1 sulfurtransferase TusA family protein [Kingella negevensis]MDK4698607.1 sulfurtransferase TusA family protein [Kingella negevensis]